MINSSWKNFYSLLKWQTFCRCEREYFLNYNYSFGGHDTLFSPTDKRLIHLLKQLKSNEVFQEILISKTLKSLFKNEIDKNLFTNKLLRTFYLARHNMLIGKYEEDHKVLLLQDFYYQTSNIQNLFDKHYQDLKNFAITFIQNEELNFLLECDYLKRHIPEELSYINLGDTTFYNGFILNVINKNNIYFLNYLRDDESNQYNAMCHCYYAWQKYKISPEKVVTFFIDTSSAKIVKFSAENVNISAQLELISKRVSSLPQYSNLEITPLAIPPNLKNCIDCRFYKYCSNKKTTT